MGTVENFIWRRLDPVLLEMEETITTESFLTEKVPPRWAGIKYLEHDEDIILKGRAVNPAVSKQLETIAQPVANHTRKTLKATPDAIIADHRYGYIASMIQEIVNYPACDTQQLCISDKMDMVLTHKLAGPLIMLAVVYLIYKITFIVGKVPMVWLDFFWLARRQP